MPKKFEHTDHDHDYDTANTDETVFDQVHQEYNYRLLNPDGTFNIDRKGKSGANMYETILGMSWLKIILLFFVFYFLINSVFALLFMSVGVENIKGIHTGTWWENFLQMIYFSIHTFTTVGYGHLSPQGSSANMLAAFVAFIGLISFAILTGLSFAKFSKPKSHILFSEKMLLAPNPNKGDKPSLQFRIVSATKNQIIDLEARVTLAWIENIGGLKRRKFEKLDLELESIHLFPLNWTIVHMIDDTSPLKGLTQNVLRAKQMEILILIKGFDDTYSQIVHSKHSYSCDNLVENAQFTPMYENTNDKTILHLSKLDAHDDYKFS